MSELDDNTHRWVVGVDLSHQGRGAERFASWLRERSRGREQARAIYEAELARIAEDENFDGLVVGRAAPSEGWALVSLGKTARKLLQELPCPVVVVPPDVDPESFGDGPVVVGVEPNDAAVAAADFGRELGQRLDLPTVLVHTVPDPNLIPHPIASPDVVPLPFRCDVDELRQSAAAALHQWAERHGLDDLPLRTRIGRGGAGLLEAARSEGASLIVCGSRRLSPLQRLFESSTSRELAAHATRPVAVVPSAA